MRWSSSFFSWPTLGFDAAQAIAVLLRLAKHVGHLPLERIEPLVEADHRRLGRGGVVGEARSVGRPALGEDPPLQLIDLPLEPIDALLGRRLAGAARARKRPARARPRRAAAER